MEKQRPSLTGKVHPIQQHNPWYRYITVDLFVYAFSRTFFIRATILSLGIFHVFFHEKQTQLAKNTFYFMIFLFFVQVLFFLNHKITWGWHFRTVRWEDEVVIITGGGSGLGRTLAETFLDEKQGVRVAVLDIKEPDGMDNVWMRKYQGRLWWGCVDVSKNAAVHSVALKIRGELGLPTILINNAATLVKGLSLLLNNDNFPAMLSPEEASKTMTINTIAHFNTLSAFLPYIISAKNGGTIVTISSLLRHLAPARLAAYAASKAAISSLHNTLMHEIASHPNAKVRRNLKTILVEPGQLDTQLFADITDLPWYANFIGPVLEAKSLARKIIDNIEIGESGIIREPFYAKCIPSYGVLPGSLQWFVRWLSGIDRVVVPAKTRGQVVK